MNDFLTKLKARVNNLELSNDANVNEDDLWNSIQVGIAEDIKDDKPRNFLFYIPFLLVTLFLIGFAGLYLTNDKVINEQEKDISVTELNSIPDFNKKSESTQLTAVSYTHLTLPTILLV